MTKTTFIFTLLLFCASFAQKGIAQGLFAKTELYRNVRGQEETIKFEPSRDGGQYKVTYSGAGFSEELRISGTTEQRATVIFLDLQVGQTSIVYHFEVPMLVDEDENLITPAYIVRVNADGTHSMFRRQYDERK